MTGISQEINCACELTAAWQRGSSDWIWTGASPFSVKPRSLSSAFILSVRGAVHLCLAENTDNGPCNTGHAKKKKPVSMTPQNAPQNTA